MNAVVCGAFKSLPPLLNTILSVRSMSIICKSFFRHPQFVLIAVLALWITALVAGCAAKGDKPDALPPPAGVRENGALVLTRVDNNRTAEVRVGERIRVRLPEKPSTGFTWAIDEANSRLLALDSTDYAEPSEVHIGASGQRTFIFTARQPGEVALKLKYWRFWEGDLSITERLAVTVQIRD